jgi:hypothetical protein
MAGLYGESVFRFVRNCEAVFTSLSALDFASVWELGCFNRCAAALHCSLIAFLMTYLQEHLFLC